MRIFKYLFLLAIFAVTAYSSYNLRDFKRNYLFNKAKSNVFLVTNEHKLGGGTGFVVELDNGEKYSITNDHVCDVSTDGQNIVAMFNGTEYNIQILERKPEFDLCLMEPVPGAPGLSLGSGNFPSQEVHIYGHPGLQPLTPSHGEFFKRQDIDIRQRGVSPEDCKGPRREVRTYRGFFGLPMEVCIRMYDSYWFTASVYPGSSGSPILDGYGRVIGVVFALGGGTKVGFAVPLDLLRHFTEEYIKVN